MASSFEIQPLSVGAVAASKMLGISERSLRQMVKERTIPFVRIRHRIVFPVDALRLWLSQKADEAANKCGSA